jgi:hypothetical protein
MLVPLFQSLSAVFPTSGTGLPRTFLAHEFYLKLSCRSTPLILLLVLVTEYVKMNVNQAEFTTACAAKPGR